jgi:hypothetical protein
MNANHPPACRDQPGIGFTSFTSFTAADYRHRIERAFHACQFGYANPYRPIIAERLEADRTDHLAAVAEAKSEPCNAF